MQNGWAANLLFKLYLLERTIMFIVTRRHHVKRTVVSQNTQSAFSLKEITIKREAAVKSIHEPLRNLLLHKTANLGLRRIRCNLRGSVYAIRAQCDASTLTFRLQKGVNISEKQST